MDITLLDLHNLAIAQRVLAIQHAAYAIEADLIGTRNIPPLNDTLETLQDSDEFFYGCWLDEGLAGIVSCLNNDFMVEICRMAVHPDYFRRGVASALLNFVERQYPEARIATVSTGAKNEPARQLYLRHGFVQKGLTMPEEGVFLAMFEKRF